MKKTWEIQFSIRTKNYPNSKMKSKSLKDMDLKMKAFKIKLLSLKISYNKYQLSVTKG